MPKKEYDWADGQIPVIHAHSLAKHRIVRRYVERYIEVLTSEIRMDQFRLDIIDGFAGGGEYRSEIDNSLTPGSPLILFEAVRAATARVKAERTKNLKVDVRFLFVEKDPRVADHLRSTLCKNDIPVDESKCRILTGSFDERLDEIIAFIKTRGRKHRALFVLDQYGYTDVPLNAIQKIGRELPDAEIFLTAAVGWMTAYFRDCRDALAKLGITQEILEEVATPGFFTHAAAQRVKQARIQHALFQTFIRETPFRFYTPFFIMSRESNRPYWLLHLAGKSRAHDVMKMLHWSESNHFTHFGSAGLSMLGYDPRYDADLSGTPFLFDNDARVQTRERLSRELVERIEKKYADGVPFQKLFEETCNETPATKEIIQEVVVDLCHAGDLHKRGESGEVRKSGTTPHDTDIIVRSKQIKMFT